MENRIDIFLNPSCSGNFFERVAILRNKQQAELFEKIEHLQKTSVSSVEEFRKYQPIEEVIDRIHLLREKERLAKELPNSEVLDDLELEKAIEMKLFELYNQLADGEISTTMLIEDSEKFLEDTKEVEPFSFHRSSEKIKKIWIVISSFGFIG